jgi:hypothetical protein
MAQKRKAAAAKAKPASKAKTKAKPRAQAKPKALALHIGLDAVSPKHYGGWSGDLAACELDAKDMAWVAKSRGMKSTTLLTKAATRAKVLAGLRAAAKVLGAGDLFFLTYSGHGGQVTDVTRDEDDGQDETWCLFDGELIDDELYFELSRFAAGVRVLVLSDSCHSGTVTREGVPRVPLGARPRLMPPAVAKRTYLEHKAFYDKLQRDVLKKAGGRIDPDAVLARLDAGARPAAGVVKEFKPAVLLISGCQDKETSLDGDRNGAFTGQLLAVWKKGAFKGSYTALHAAVKKGLRGGQTPNLFLLGPAKEFAGQQAFSV